MRTITLSVEDVEELLHDAPIEFSKQRDERTRQAVTILKHSLGVHGDYTFTELAQAMVDQNVKAQKSMFNCTRETGRDHADGI